MTTNKNHTIMKNIKLLLPACVMMLFVFASCDNSQKKNDGKETATVTVTPDLTYWELQGPVKRCDEVKFDRQGTMVGIDEYDPFAIDQAYRESAGEDDFVEYAKWERDEEGYIASITGMEGMSEYTWNDGRVVSAAGFEEGTVWKNDFEYDAEGRLVKLIEYIGGFEDEEDELPLWSTTEYSYLEFDSHGNWIRRAVKVTLADMENTEDYEETRTIEYYE